MQANPPRPNIARPITPEAFYEAAGNHESSLRDILITSSELMGLPIVPPQISDQAAIAEMLEECDVFIIDNLSTAASGMSENDNDAFDRIKDWLLELRGRKVTVLIVHHAGRNGEMRGASRREDMAQWIISLKDDSGDGEQKAWLTHFKKCRNCQSLEASSLRWIIKTDEDRLTYQCEKHSGPEAMYALIRDGIETAPDLAEELSVNKGDLNKWSPTMIQKMIESGDNAGQTTARSTTDRSRRQKDQRLPWSPRRTL